MARSQAWQQQAGLPPAVPPYLGVNTAHCKAEHRTYTKAEATLHFAAGGGAMAQDVKVRNVVKYTDYKQFRSSARIIYNGQDITDKKDDSQQPAPDNKQDNKKK